MFSLENRGETLIFMSRYFNKAMTILISHFFRFDALKNQLVKYFVLRINKIIYSKPKSGRFIHFSIFPSTFPTASFPHSFVQVGVQMAYGKYLSASKW